MDKSTYNDIPLKDRAYLMLKEKIINCQLEPGSPINEAKLAEELNMSRTPVREAILRLNEEGLITIYPRKGTIVSEITMEDIREIFQIRQLIEPVVAREYYKNMCIEDLIDFRSKFEKIKLDLGEESVSDYYKLDIDFHRYIVGSSGNLALIEFMDKIYDHSNRIRVKSKNRLEDIEHRSKIEHFIIIDSILSAREKDIYDNLRRHLEHSKMAALLQL